MKPNTNILYYFAKSKRSTKRIEGILHKLNIPYVNVKLKEKNVDKTFLSMILECCPNGFTDIIKSSDNLSLDFDDLTYNELVYLISKSPKKYLKDSFFLGLNGQNGVVMSRGLEDDYTIYLKYENREMSKLYAE